jgi:hypothetical protein
MSFLQLPSPVSTPPSTHPIQCSIYSCLLSSHTLQSYSLGFVFQPNSSPGTRFGELRDGAGKCNHTQTQTELWIQVFVTQSSFYKGSKRVNVRAEGSAVKLIEPLRDYVRKG